MADPIVNAPPAPSAPPPAPEWHAGINDPGIVGHAQLKGWDLSDPAKAFGAAAQAHLAAERMLGVPADQVIKLPKADDAAGQTALWQRLGAPKEAKEYGFDGIGADLGDQAAAYAEHMRAAALKANTPKASAEALVAADKEFRTQVAAKAAAAVASKIAEEKAALATSWGPNHEANMFIAKNAATKLGLDQSAVAALAEGVGLNQVMQMFHKLGLMMGEDKFVNGGAGPAGQTNVMSRAMAVARKSALMADRAWSASYLAGDAEKGKEMRALNTLIVGA